MCSHFDVKKLQVLIDLNTLQKDWLGSTKVDCQDKIAGLFTISNNPTNLIPEPTYFPQVSSQDLYVLHFLTNRPRTYQTSTSSTSGHSSVLEPTGNSRSLTTWYYSFTNWNGFSLSFRGKKFVFQSWFIRDLLPNNWGNSNYSSNLRPTIYLIPRPRHQNQWSSQDCVKARHAKDRDLRISSPENRPRSPWIISDSNPSFTCCIKYSPVLSAPTCFGSLSKA